MNGKGRQASRFPYQAEPLALPHAFETENELFFVRNHAPVPKIDAAQHSIAIYREDQLLASYTFDELLSQFELVELHSTLQCTGNRLSELLAAVPKGSATYNAFSGTPDLHGHMISNARWDGVPLAALLRATARSSSLGDDLGKCAWIEFHGTDGYYTAVPASAVLPDEQEAMLAVRMNGKPLPRDHGAPVRAVLPGCVGARNVKWVEAIVLRDDMGTSPWNVLKYRHDRPDGRPIWHWPVSSQVTHVQGVPISSMEKVSLAVPEQSKPIKLEGFAYAGGGVPVKHVEVSVNDGLSWHPAKLVRQEMRASGKQWAWLLWEFEVSRAAVEEGKSLVVLSRATDATGSTQPLRSDGALAATPSGYLFNPVQRIVVSVCSAASSSTASTCD